MNDWSYNFTPQYSFMAWCLVKAQRQLYLYLYLYFNPEDESSATSEALVSEHQTTQSKNPPPKKQPNLAYHTI
jgi:hypothetical protein